MNGKLILILLLILAITPPTAAYLLIPSPSPTVSITKLYNTSLQSGQSIIINVTVSDVSEIIACYLNLAFNSSVLKVTTGDPHGWKDPQTGIRYGVYEGPFLKTASNSTIFLINGVNNALGEISAVYDAITVPAASASGSGVIATINFTCLNPTANTAINMTGPSTLQPITAGVYDIPHEDINGFVTASGPPGIWTELWFQAAVIVVIVEIVIVGLGIFATIRWWRSRAKAENEERSEVEDLFR